MTGPRARATADAIESAALDLVLERGYDNVTVDLICDAAGVSQRTFFNHFPTKDDAMLGRDRPSIDQHAARRFIIGNGPLISDALALIAPPDPDKPSSLLAARMRAIASSPALLAGHTGRITELDTELSEIITLRLENQRPDAEPREREADAAMVSLLIGAVMRWVVSEAATDEKQADLGTQLALARDTLARILGPESFVSTQP